MGSAGSGRKMHYATADVFSDHPFGGNPVAVVLEAESLNTAEMQSIANEFNYVETTFVLPPEVPGHTAKVRIFTPDREIPFAGHPTLGTAFLLSRENVIATPGGDRLLLEEEAGLVEVRLQRSGDEVVGAELETPRPLATGAAMEANAAARLIGLSAEDVCDAIHPPMVGSVGLPFVLVGLHSRAALRRARPSREAFDELLPFDGARSVYLYSSEVDASEAGCDVSARMFTWRLAEDPATGSAAAALAGVFAMARSEDVDIRVAQGTDMGRPSRIGVRTTNGGRTIFLAGSCVAMLRGTFSIGMNSAAA